MDVRDLFPTEYVAAHDLKGRDVTLTISKVTGEPLRTEGGVKTKLIVAFAEMEKRPEKDRKRFIVNKTNMRTIAAMYGHESADWIGKKITIYPTECEAFNKTVPCIRVRPQEN